MQNPYGTQTIIEIDIEVGQLCLNNGDSGAYRPLEDSEEWFLSNLACQMRLGQKDFDFRKFLLSILRINRLDKKANKTEF